jgi:hypothetical protein
MVRSKGVDKELKQPLHVQVQTLLVDGFSIITKDKRMKLRTRYCPLFFLRPLTYTIPGREI